MDSPIRQDPALATTETSVDEHNLQRSGSHTSQHGGDKATKEPMASNAVEDASLDVSLPLNWPTRKKVLNIGVPSIACFVV